MNSLGLGNKDFDIVQHILATHLPGRAVYAFGSRATGRARRYSDLDLAVEGEPLTLREEALLKYAFEESDLSITVDVINLAQASGVFRSRIERELIAITPFQAQKEQIAA